MKAVVLTILGAAYSSVWAQPPSPTPTPATLTPATAFNLGKSDGAAGTATVTGSINSTSAATNVDSYSTTNSNSSYFSGGNGNPRTFGAVRVTDCATTVYPDARNQAECAGINQVAGDRSRRPVTPMTPSDPMLVRGKVIVNDPVSVAGAFTSGYSACTTQNVTTPPVYQTEFCTQERSLQTQTCTKLLTVNIVLTPSCTPGTWYGGYMIGIPIDGWFNRVDALCNPDRTDGMIQLRFTPVGLHGVCYAGSLNAPMAPFAVTTTLGYRGAGANLTTAHNYKGSCTVTNWIAYEPGYTQGCVSEVCSYTFRIIDSRWGNLAVGGTPGLRPPGNIHTEVDVWDTAACDILQARTLP